MKATLYIDVDDTIMCGCYAGTGFDLRPGVVTQLRVLSKLFKCKWLTCWSHNDSKYHHSVTDLMRNLYGHELNKNILYADWGHGHEWRKAGYVLDPKHDQNFWWLEDPLCAEELKALKDAGKLDRYIRVEPKGNWGFLVAINELFKRAGITETHLKKVGAKPEWFSLEHVQKDTSNEDKLEHTLSLIELMTREHGQMAPLSTLLDVRQLVQSHLKTIYKR